MNLIRGFRQKRVLKSRVKAVNNFLQQKLDYYDGEGDGSIVVEQFDEKDKKSVVLHCIITKKPFDQVKATVVMAAIGSFSVKVSNDDYQLYRLWFDRKGDNSPTHMLTTSDSGELEQLINDEWEKGIDGKFFRK